jgi:hypothetical protein
VKNEIDEDKYIEERVEAILRQGALKIGIVSSSMPTWVWHVGTIGKVQWMRSPEDLMGRIEEDRLTPVEATLVQGQWPLVDNSVWKMESLHTAIKVVIPRRKSKVNSAAGVLPVGWKGYTSYTLCHTSLGGVANGRFLVEVRTRSIPKRSVQLAPPSVSGKLGEALSMKEGGRTVPIADIGELNTASGILDWRHMKKGGKVKTLSIYYKIGGVERSMSVQETAQVLDFPGTRASRMTDKQIKILTDSELPGKVITASIFFLTTRNKEPHTSTEERHTPCEVQVETVKEEIDYQGRNRDNQGIAIEVESRDSNGIASSDKAKDDEGLIEGSDVRAY